MRSVKCYSIKDVQAFKQKLLQWSSSHEEVVWLDSNAYDQHLGSFDAILAVAAFTAIKTDHTGAFAQLQEYQETTKDWIFGYLSYDLKNDVEDLLSENFDGLGFPELYFFQPQKLFLVKDRKVELHYLQMVDDEMEGDLEAIFRQKPGGESIPGEKSPGEEIRARISKAEYLEKIHRMLGFIQRGDIYEANFCQEFFAENREIRPLETFSQLNEISRPPFAVYLKLEQYYLLSASPERYIRKSGKHILSQPIKGTARRSEDTEVDLRIARELETDPKERSENIMIVDLVRNDLSKIAQKGSVKVEELCKVFSFKQVHQMISTVSAELEKGIPVVEAIRATFPMGSMTGAPKISAMQIIEQLEETKRGLYSGAVGYFDPEGDFDFSVVIRSILYNAERRYVSFSVGGAITAGSQPEKEYQECLLKARAMWQVLS